MSDIHDCGVCGLPNEIHGESCLCREAVATLRTRLAAAEAERDALRDQRDASFEDVASLNGDLERAMARAEQAEAERDRARDLWSAELEHANKWARRAHEAEAEVARLRVHVDFWQERVGEVRAEQAEAERDELRARCAEMTTKADAWSYAARALERADQAEAERDEARAALAEANEITSNLLDRLVERSAERDAAEAEVARLRGAREAALREAAGVLRDAAKKHRHDADASRSVAASGGHVLAADILDSYANVIELLDAAPAAEWCDCGDEFRPGVAGATADQCGICASVTPAAEGGE